MAGPLKSFLNKAGEVASNVGGAVAGVASTVVDKVDDHLETIRGGTIKVPYRVVNGVALVDKTSDDFLIIDPADFERA